MEWAEAIDVVGAFMAAVTMYFVGRIRGRNNERERLAVEARTEVCTCSHGVSFHDRNGCHHTKPLFETVVIDRYDPYGDGTERLLTDERAVGERTCTCLRYVGPISTYDPDSAR